MLKAQIESLLFISVKPLTAQEIFKFLKKDLADLTLESVSETLEELKNEYQTGHGFTLIEVGGQYQFTTSVENADLIKKFLREDQTGELTQPSLEALTVIAYRGPITKPVLEQIRGVNCSLILRNLLMRGLIVAEENETDTLYQVTPDFLKFLGLNSISELPNYAGLHSVENLEQFLASRQAEANTQT